MCARACDSVVGIKLGYIACLWLTKIQSPDTFTIEIKLGHIASYFLKETIRQINYAYFTYIEDRTSSKLSCSDLLAYIFLKHV